MYKIIARTAWDYVEIGPYKTFEDCVDDLYNSFYTDAQSTQSKQTTIEKQSHPLIKEILSLAIAQGQQ